MVSAAIRHPIRVRLLEVLSVRDEISATTFIHQGLGREIAELKNNPPQQQVTEVSYHLKQLEEAGAVSETRSVPRRGGTERFFKANAVAYFSDEEWAETALSQRREISRVVAQGLIVQIEGAFIAETFDSREDRWLYWDPKTLDERGWSEMTTAFAAFLAEARHIEDGSGRRLKEAGEDGEPIPATFALVMFESPEPPRLPDEDPDAGEDAPTD